jgi:hypothetical protein
MAGPFWAFNLWAAHTLSVTSPLRRGGSGLFTTIVAAMLHV